MVFGLMAKVFSLDQISMSNVQMKLVISILLWAHSCVGWGCLSLCDSNITMVGLCYNDSLVLSCCCNNSLCDIVWLVLSNSDVVLLNISLGDVVRFLDSLVNLLGDGDVVGNLDSVGAVVGVSDCFHVVVGTRHLLLDCVDVSLGHSSSIVGHLGLINNLVWERLGNKLVLNHSGGVVQSLCDVFVQSCWHILCFSLPLGVVLHLCVGRSFVHSLIVALLGTGILLGGRRIGDGWCRRTVGWGRRRRGMWCTIRGWRTSSWVVGLSDHICH